MIEENIKIGITEVIKVAAEDVEAELLGIHNCLEIRQSENYSVRQCLIHLGVAAGSKSIRVEKYGRNQANFGCPDER